MKTAVRFTWTFLFCMAGVFVASAIYRVFDYLMNQEKYAVMSAPWYTSILVQGEFTAAIGAVCIVVILILKFAIKKTADKE